MIFYSMELTTHFEKACFQLQTDHLVSSTRTTYKIIVFQNQNGVMVLNDFN